jgi:hypothetical protein
VRSSLSLAGGGGGGDTELTRRSIFGRRGHTTATYPCHGYGFARVSIWLPVPVPVAKPAENPRVYPYP